MDESDTESGSCDTKRIPSHAQVSMRRPSILAPLGRQHHYGSFYLRMGAVGKKKRCSIKFMVHNLHFF